MLVRIVASPSSSLAMQVAQFPDSHEYGGDRRKMTEAQNQPGYWEKLQKPE